MYWSSGSITTAALSVLSLCLLCFVAPFSIPQSQKSVAKGCFTGVRDSDDQVGTLMPYLSLQHHGTTLSSFVACAPNACLRRESLYEPNTDQDILYGLSRAGTGTVQTRTHAFVHTCPATIALSFARSLGSAFVPWSHLSSRPRPVLRRIFHSRRPPSGCTLPSHSTRLRAASERVGGLWTRKRRHPIRKAVGLLTWTWHRAVHGRAYGNAHIYAHARHTSLSVVPAFAVATLFALLFSSRADFRGRGCVAT